MKPHYIKKGMISNSKAQDNLKITLKGLPLTNKSLP